jgi:hypothetical protein
VDFLLLYCGSGACVYSLGSDNSLMLLLYVGNYFIRGIFSGLAAHSDPFWVHYPYGETKPDMVT